jgi:hypothetical protein
VSHEQGRLEPSFFSRVGYNAGVSFKTKTRCSASVRKLAFCGNLFALTAQSSARAEWTEESGEFIIGSWEIGDGLPYSHIRDIIQRKNGFLWVVSKTGAARFDGIEFELFHKLTHPELSDNQMTTLHEDSFEVFYIGHETGVVTVRKGSAFISLPPPEELSGFPVTRFVETGDGVVWAVFHSGQAAQVGRDGMPVAALEPMNEPPGPAEHHQYPPTPDAIHHTQHPKPQSLSPRSIIWTGRPHTKGKIVTAQYAG